MIYLEGFLCTQKPFIYYLESSLESLEYSSLCLSQILCRLDENVIPWCWRILKVMIWFYPTWTGRADNAFFYRLVLRSMTTFDCLSDWKVSFRALINHIRKQYSNAVELRMIVCGLFDVLASKSSSVYCF